MGVIKITKNYNGSTLINSMLRRMLNNQDVPVVYSQDIDWRDHTVTSAYNMLKNSSMPITEDVTYFPSTAHVLAALEQLYTDFQDHVTNHPGGATGTVPTGPTGPIGPTGSTPVNITFSNFSLSNYNIPYGATGELSFSVNPAGVTNVTCESYLGDYAQVVYGPTLANSGYYVINIKNNNESDINQQIFTSGSYLNLSAEHPNASETTTYKLEYLSQNAYVLAKPQITLGGFTFINGNNGGATNGLEWGTTGILQFNVGNIPNKIKNNITIGTTGSIPSGMTFTTSGAWSNSQNSSTGTYVYYFKNINFSEATGTVFNTNNYVTFVANSKVSGYRNAVAKVTGLNVKLNPKQLKDVILEFTSISGLVNNQLAYGATAEVTFTSNIPVKLLAVASGNSNVEIVDDWNNENNFVTIHTVRFKNNTSQSGKYNLNDMSVNVAIDSQNSDEYGDWQAGVNLENASDYSNIQLLPNQTPEVTYYWYAGQNLTDNYITDSNYQTIATQNEFTTKTINMTAGNYLYVVVPSNKSVEITDPVGLALLLTIMIHQLQHIEDNKILLLMIAI